MRSLPLLTVVLLLVACDAGTDPGPCLAECAEIHVTASIVRGVARTESDSVAFESASVEEQVSTTSQYVPYLISPAVATVNDFNLDELSSGGVLFLDRSTRSFAPFLAPVGVMNRFFVEAGPLVHGLNDSIATPALDAQLLNLAPDDTLHLDSQIEITLVPVTRADTNTSDELGLQFLEQPTGDPRTRRPLTSEYTEERGLNSTAEISMERLLAMGFGGSALRGPVWLRIARTIQHHRVSPSGRSYTIRAVAYEEIPVVIAP